jgi:hypothetical protein
VSSFEKSFEKKQFLEETNPMRLKSFNSRSKISCQDTPPTEGCDLEDISKLLIRG